MAQEIIEMKLRPRLFWALHSVGDSLFIFHDRVENDYDYQTIEVNNCKTQIFWALQSDGDVPVHGTRNNLNQDPDISGPSSRLGVCLFMAQEIIEIKTQILLGPPVSWGCAFSWRRK